MGCGDVPGGEAAAAPPPPAAPARGSPGGRVSLPGGRCRAGSVSSQVTPRGGKGGSRQCPVRWRDRPGGAEGRTGRATTYGGAVAARTKGERRAGQGYRQTPGGARLPPSLAPCPAAAAALPGRSLPRDRPPSARDAPKFAGLRSRPVPAWVRGSPAAPALSGGTHRARPAAEVPAVWGGRSPVGSGSPLPGEGGGEAPSLCPCRRAAAWAPLRGRWRSLVGARTARAVTALPWEGSPRRTGLLDRGEEGWQQLCAG